jgi:putative DNA primase/helicase
METISEINPLTALEIGEEQFASTEDTKVPTAKVAPANWIFGNPINGQEQKSQFVYPLTDLGNAHLFFRLSGKHVHWEDERGAWLANDGTRWLNGTSARRLVMKFFKKLVTRLYRQAKSNRSLRTRNGETVTPDEALQWAKSTSQNGRKKAILELVRDMPGVRISTAALDPNPFLLGVKNGVLDLRTATLIENHPEMLITRYANAAYRQDAEAPIFLGFMDQICLGRQDLVDYIQKTLGYCLSGLIKTHAFFFLVGIGANGKTTLVEAFLQMLGGYGVGMPSHAFLNSNSRAVRNDLARLPGARFAPCAEVNTGMILDESMVKRATGGDVMTARFIGKEFFDFHPVAKFFFSVNTMPTVLGADNGIYRRIVVIPFDGNFETNMDVDLPEKLKAESDGILAWAVQGFLQWQKNKKLAKPPCIVKACASYRGEMDTLQAFLDECCTLEPDAVTPVGNLHHEYLQWAKGSGVDPVRLHLFGRLMVQKRFKKIQSGGWKWKGVKIKAAAPDAETSIFGGPATPSATSPDPSTMDLKQ